MAIKLSGTPQQQKAPFSAFDTSSGFQSGLTQVGQALQQAGAGQARIAQRAEVDLKRKSNAAQELAVYGSRSNLSSKIKSAADEVSLYTNTGDLDKLRAAQDNFNSLEFSLDQLNNNRPEGTVTSITESDYSTKALIDLKNEYERNKRKLDRELAEKDLLKSQVEVLEVLEQSVLKNNRDNKKGNTGDQILEIVDSSANNDMLRIAYDGATIGQGQTAFRNSERSSIMSLIEHQFVEGVPLTIDELNDRRDAIDQVFEQYGERFEFDASDLAKYNKLYKEKKEEIENPEYQKELAKTNLDYADSSLSLVADQGQITTQDAYKLISTISAIPDSYLTSSQLIKKQSLLSFALFFDPEDYNSEPVAYQMLEVLALQPKDSRQSVADLIKTMSGSNVDGLKLQPTEQNRLNDWFDARLRDLNNVVESPENIGLLSPFHSDLLKKVKNGDSFAYSNLEREYKSFVDSNPNIKGVPNVFYIEQTSFPTGSLGAVETAVASVKANITTNELDNVITNANFRLERGDLTAMELLNYTAQKMAATRMSMMGADSSTESQRAVLAEQVQGDLESFFSYYKAGTEVSTEVNAIYSDLVARSNKNDMDEYEDALPLLNQKALLQNLGLNSRANLLDTIFKGFIQKDLNLLNDKNDKERYEHIRTEMRKQDLLIPKVARSESGALIQVPNALAGHISDDLHEDGIFKTVSGYSILKRKLGDQETLGNVAFMYAAAGLNQMFDQYKDEINLREFYSDIEGRIPNDRSIAGPTTFTNLGAMPARTDEQVQEDQDAEAWVTGVMNNTDEAGRPLARFGEPEMVTMPDGSQQLRAPFLILTTNNDYVKVATDDGFMGFNVNQSVRTVEKVMPSIVDFFNNFMDPDTSFVSGFSYYARNILGVNEGALQKRVDEQHGIQYRGESTRTEKYQRLFGLTEEQADQRVIDDLKQDIAREKNSEEKARLQKILTEYSK